MSTANVDTWLAKTGEALTAAKYRLNDGVSFESSTFRRVAYKSGFQLSKLGNVETFFVFGDVANSDPSSLKLFSANAYKYARAAKRSWLPCGLFEAVICYAVAIVDVLDDATSASIKVTAPTKHWAAFEVPVVYESSRGTYCTFEQTPIWGAAYYRGFRAQIAQFLGTGAPS